MAHGSHTLQHWNQWLSQQFLGKYILETESHQFNQLLKRHFGKHAILMGVPNQHDLLHATKIPCQSLVTPLMPHEKSAGFIEGDFHELPIQSGSMDLVMLPHTWNLWIIREQYFLKLACIIKPEGLIVITDLILLACGDFETLESK